MESERYYEGRRTRAKGLPRAIADGRCSPSSRQEFYRGWDEEDRARAIVMDQGGSIATMEELAAFKAETRAMIEGGAPILARIDEVRGAEGLFPETEHLLQMAREAQAGRLDLADLVKMLPMEGTEGK